MPFTARAKSEAHALFDDQRPLAIGLVEEDVVGFVSAMCFRPMDDGEMVMRLAGEDGELIDLRTNQPERLVRRRSSRDRQWIGNRTDHTPRKQDVCLRCRKRLMRCGSDFCSPLEPNCPSLLLVR